MLGDSLFPHSKRSLHKDGKRGLYISFFIASTNVHISLDCSYVSFRNSEAIYNSFRSTFSNILSVSLSFLLLCNSDENVTTYALHCLKMVSNISNI